MLFGALLLLYPVPPRAQGNLDVAAASDDGLTPAELSAAFDQLDLLGAFFSALAERDTNGFARDRWRRLGVNYRSTAKLLHGLLARGEIVIDDLPSGRSSALLADGKLVIDSDLDGRWTSDPLLLPSPEEAALRRRELLEPVLMQALARRYSPQNWQWMADHLHDAGALGDLAQQWLARALLARFFQAKDAYFWYAMQRIATGNPEPRLALARRQAATFESVRGLRSDMAAAFGSEAAYQLQRDWAAYVAQVDGFALTRGWVLLDPVLKRTQVGALARQEADAVERAAEEMVAAAPRTAVAAAASGLELKKQVGPAEPVKLQRFSLTALLPERKVPSTDELAARLPLDVLALSPDAPASASNTAAFRAFAAKVKEALAEPDPREIIAAQEKALGAAEKELDTLKTRVAELDQGLSRHSAATVELEAALEAERTRLAAAERTAAEQSAAAERLAAEVAALEMREAELDRDLAAGTARSEALERELEAERTRLAAAERTAAEQSAAAERLAAEVAALAALETRVAELDRDLATRAARSEALERELAAERARLSAAERTAAEQSAAAERLAAEVAALAALETRVAELDRDLAARAARSEALERELAAERARLAAAEQRAAAQGAAVENLSAEVRELAALESRLAELDAALAARNREAEALAGALADERARLAEAEQRAEEAAAAPPPGDREALREETRDLTALLLRIEERQLLLIGALAVIFLLGLLLWLRSRRQSAAAAEAAAPLLLTTAVRDEEEPEVIDLVETPATESAEEESGFTPQPASLKTGDGAPRIYGVAPQTAAARAAMRAGSARTEAARAASRGSEGDAATHPIVQALRKGNLPLFELLFSELTGLRAPRLQRIVYGGRGEDLAIVCRAVGIDKLLFGSIYLLTDSFRGGDADEESQHTREILRMYDRMPAATAKKVLAKWQRNWGQEVVREEDEEESLA